MFDISDDLADAGGRCPLCGTFLKRGELGPSGVPIITPVLSSLPSSHVLSYGARRHDVAYHMGSSWGIRKQADDLMYYENNKLIKSLKLPWYKASFLHTMNYRNWWTVRMFGGKFWNEKGCAS